MNEINTLFATLFRCRATSHAKLKLITKELFVANINLIHKVD